MLAQDSKGSLGVIQLILHPLPGCAEVDPGLPVLSSREESLPQPSRSWFVAPAESTAGSHCSATPPAPRAPPCSCFARSWFHFVLLQGSHRCPCGIFRGFFSSPLLSNLSKVSQQQLCPLLSSLQFGGIRNLLSSFGLVI